MAYPEQAVRGKCPCSSQVRICTDPPSHLPGICSVASSVVSLDRYRIATMRLSAVPVNRQMGSLWQCWDSQAPGRLERSDRSDLTRKGLFRRSVSLYQYDRSDSVQADGRRPYGQDCGHSSGRQCHRWLPGRHYGYTTVQCLPCGRALSTMILITHTLPGYPQVTIPGWSYHQQTDKHEVCRA